ncbi:MAG: hypothetical protein Q7T11_01785 [Deltaproteobacteria bacterium]|nr:hypothetical protein [Deltaproteobacteria bacterium]
MSTENGMLTLQEDGKIAGYPGWRFLSLIRDGEGPSQGVIAMNEDSLELRAIPALAILAPGSGLGVTLSLLYRQGAALVNPEFFQFHPAFVSGAETPFCLGDAVLEAGGRFWADRNGKPWYFLEEIYPGHGKTLPHLVINRTLDKISRDLGQVYLDLTGVSPTNGLQSLFSQVRRRFKIDPSKKSIPVEPGIIGSLGGLWSDSNGMTSIPGLYCHPERQAKDLPGMPGRSFADAQDDSLRLWHSKLLQIFESGGPENVFRLQLEMKQCVAESMGVSRENRQLKKASEKLEELSRRCGQISLSDKARRSNRELMLALTLPALVDQARVSVAAALLRNETRGEHYKPEFSKQDDAHFLKKTKAVWANGGPKIEYEDVQSLF